MRIENPAARSFTRQLSSRMELLVGGGDWFALGHTARLAPGCDERGSLSWDHRLFTPLEHPRAEPQ